MCETVLHLFEQLAIVEEEPLRAALDHGLQDADGEMRFAYADVAGEQDADAVGVKRISLHKLFRGQMRVRERGRGRAELGLKAIKGAVLVTSRDAGLREGAGVAQGDAAGAGLGEAIAVGALGEAEAGALAEIADGG